MSQWMDISRPIDTTLPVWPGRTPPQHRWEKGLAAGDNCNVSHWNWNAHSGTHMDAPLHFFAEGLPIDAIVPDVFIGPCEIVDLPEGQLLMEHAARLAGVKRLLIRTTHSHVTAGNNYPSHAAIATEAAVDALVKGGLLLMGVDRLSVDDSAGKDFAVHRKVLGAGCVIVEGLELSQVSEGTFTMYAAPLRLTGTEASPVRAFVKPAPLSGTAKPFP